MSSIDNPWTPSSDAAVSPWAIRIAARKFGLRERGEKHTPDIEAKTIAELNERDITHGWSQKHEIKTCTPPIQNLRKFGRETRWAELHGDRFKRFLAASAPVIWADNAGAGKTTNAALGAMDQAQQHALVFSTHEKAREHVLDETTPDGYIHLKGRDQPCHDCCLDARIAADEGEDAYCSEHGKEDDWPRMCPLSELDEGHSRRKRFEVLSAIIGSRNAHQKFCSDDCPWVEQYDGLEERERVVGVHEHQKFLAEKGFTVIIDETPRLHGDEAKWTTTDLRRAGNLLISLETEHAQVLSEFVRNDLLDAVVEGSFDGTRPPALDSGDLAETLTRLKMAYNELLQIRVDLDMWDGTPACFDAIIAALAELGFPSTSCREAIAASSTLDNCPHCGGPIHFRDDVRQCMACYWEEGRFDVLPNNGRERTRAIAYLETEDNPRVSENRLCFTSLSDLTDLLESPLILDATATSSKIAGFYGVPVDDIIIEGDHPCEQNANIVQIRDGAYHPGTIDSAFDNDRRKLDDRLQRRIDIIAGRHDRPLFISKRSLLRRFEFPDHAETRHYGGLRGLNMQECDAVVCIGAPHPNLSNLEYQARLLAMDHPDLEVGGEEYGTRDGAPNPPVYRKLYYEDEHGRGRAVPTKHFTGLVGDLFYEAREKEIEQAVHRIRPLLADEAKDVYLLTNVPTELPVDEFVELTAISDEPIAVHLPVKQDVIPHLVEPIAKGSDFPDGMEVTEETITGGISEYHALAGKEEWSDSTLRRRVNELVDLGLIEKSPYIQDQGYRYTADRAAFARVLLVTSSTSEKPGLVNYFREKTRAAGGSLDWLDWADCTFVTPELEGM